MNPAKGHEDEGLRAPVTQAEFERAGIAELGHGRLRRDLISVYKYVTRGSGEGKRKPAADFSQ